MNKTLVELNYCGYEKDKHTYQASIDENLFLYIDCTDAESTTLRSSVTDVILIKLEDLLSNLGITDYRTKFV